MAKRFNPPPGWPPPPSQDWLPPVGWEPPNNMPPAPKGWRWFIEESERRLSENPPPDPYAGTSRNESITSSPDGNDGTTQGEVKRTKRSASNSWTLRLTVLILLAVPIVVLLSPGNSSQKMTRSEAFCADLRAGYSPFQITGKEVLSGQWTPSTAADRAYGFAAISCPEQLRSNEVLRAYLESFYINPDA